MHSSSDIRPESLASEKPSGKPRLGAWKRFGFGSLFPVLVVELEGRIGTIRRRVEGRGFDKPGVADLPHQASELAGYDPPRAVNQGFGQHDRGRQVVAWRGEGPGDGGDRGPVAGPRRIRIKPRRKVRPPVNMIWWPAEWSFEP